MLRKAKRSGQLYRVAIIQIFFLVSLASSPRQCVRSHVRFQRFDIFGKFGQLGCLPGGIRHRGLYWLGVIHVCAILDISADEQNAVIHACGNIARRQIGIADQIRFVLRRFRIVFPVKLLRQCIRLIF